MTNFSLGKGAKIKKWSGDYFAHDPRPPQHKVVPLLCFGTNSKVVPPVIFADPPPPKWSRDHFFLHFYFCILPLRTIMRTCRGNSVQLVIQICPTHSFKYVERYTMMNQTF